MEWMEGNYPWNFDNNLLLLGKWRKGLSISNIDFTHSPLWVQIWGLPFVNLSEDVGRDLGNSLGHYIETYKRSWLSEQARFIRIQVDLLFNKPLRRGGNIVNLEGEKTWVAFKYERLPTFCYQCGWLGHDEKHCQNHPFTPNSPKQYGDWMRASGNQKGSAEISKSQNSWGFDEGRSGKSSDKSMPETATSSNPDSEELARTEIQSYNKNKKGIALEVVGGLEGTTS